MNSTIHELYNWLFHYNPFQEVWEAVKRDHSIELFSNRDSPFIIRSKSIQTLQELIVKTGGDINKLPK